MVLDWGHSRVTLAWFAVLAFANPHANGAALHSPWDARPMPLTDVAYACPAAVAIPRDLITDGFYRLDDPTHSIVDPVRMEAYTRTAGPVKQTGAEIVEAADEFRRSGSRAAAHCVIDRTVALAIADSFAGRMSSQQADYVQGWIGGAIAIAYLKVRGSGLGTMQQEVAIDAWLKKIGASTQAYYDQRLAKGQKQNNHYYWAGVELAAIGIAANDKAMYDWGIQSYKYGVGLIQPDGTLPLEMERGKRALHYHLYALAPLIVLAEFGAANGTNLYAYDDGAIHRLVKVCVAGIADPGQFEKATGVKQESEGVPSGDQIGWAVPYVRRFPNPALSRYIAGAPTLSVFYAGGLPPD